MKIVFADNTLILFVEENIERLYLERLGLKNDGDVAKCTVSYDNSGFSLEIVKVEDRKEEEE